jgi:hypothetical protein
MAHIADDIVSYEHDASLQYVGVDAVREICNRGARPDRRRSRVGRTGHERRIWRGARVLLRCAERGIGLDGGTRRRHRTAVQHHRRQ